MPWRWCALNTGNVGPRKGRNLPCNLASRPIHTLTKFVHSSQQSLSVCLQETANMVGGGCCTFWCNQSTHKTSSAQTKSAAPSLVCDSEHIASHLGIIPVMSPTPCSDWLCASGLAWVASSKTSTKKELCTSEWAANSMAC